MNTRIRAGALGAAISALALLVTAAPAGALSFAELGGSPFPVGDGPVGVEKADFNEDGDLDLVTPNRLSDTVSVLLGASGGDFRTPTNIPAGDGPNAVAIADFNADGDPDLATTNDNDVSVLLGGAGGSFGPPTSIAAGDTPTDLEVGQFNSDRDPDLLVSHLNSDEVSVLYGGPGASFGAPTTASNHFPNPRLRVGDFNSDGFDDFAEAPLVGTDSVYVSLGDGNGNFADAGPSPTTRGPGVIRVADFNDDGDPDLALTGFPGNVAVMLGRGDGTFRGPREFTLTDGTNYSIGVGDVNADGDPDVLAPLYGSDSVAVLVGGPGASFSAPTRFAVGQSPIGVETGDFDADGLSDLGVANYSSDDVSVLLNRTWSALSAAPTSRSYGTQPVGTLGPPQAVTIRNTGQEPLRVASVRTVGTHPDDFLVSSDSCTAARVPRAGTCTVGVRFGPTATGARGAGLRIASNGRGSPRDVLLTGSGTGATRAVGPQGRLACRRSGRPRRVRCAVRLTRRAGPRRIQALLSRRDATFASGRSRRGSRLIGMRAHRRLRRTRYRLILLRTTGSGETTVTRDVVRIR